MLVTRGCGRCRGAAPGALSSSPEASAAPTPSPARSRRSSSGSRPRCSSTGGVGALAAALAGDEVRRGTRLEPHGDQRRDAGGEAVEHDDRAGLGRAEHGAGEHAELRSADGGQRRLGRRAGPAPRAPGPAPGRTTSRLALAPCRCRRPRRARPPRRRAGRAARRPGPRRRWCCRCRPRRAPPARWSPASVRPSVRPRAEQAADRRRRGRRRARGRRSAVPASTTPKSRPAARRRPRRPTPRRGLAASTSSVTVVGVGADAVGGHRVPSGDQQQRTGSPGRRRRAAARRPRAGRRRGPARPATRAA